MIGPINMRINVATNVCSDGKSIFHNQVYKFEPSYITQTRVRIICYQILIFYISVGFRRVFLALI